MHERFHFLQGRAGENIFLQIFGTFGYNPPVEVPVVNAADFIGIRNILHDTTSFLFFLSLGTTIYYYSFGIASIPGVRCNTSNFSK